MLPQRIQILSRTHKPETRTRPPPVSPHLTRPAPPPSARLETRTAPPPSARLEHNFLVDRCELCVLILYITTTTHRGSSRGGMDSWRWCGAEGCFEQTSGSGRSPGALTHYSRLSPIKSRSTHFHRYEEIPKIASNLHVYKPQNARLRTFEQRESRLLQHVRVIRHRFHGCCSPTSCPCRKAGVRDL